MPKSSTAMLMPALAQPRQPLGDRRLVDQQRAFGDLDRHPRGIDAGGADLVEQPLVVTRRAKCPAAAG